MTLIRIYQAFTDWMKQHPAVKTSIKPNEEIIDQSQYQSQIRSANSLLAELTITPRRNHANHIMVVHTMEECDGDWLLSAGGDYRESTPGIYDLFGSTSLIISALKQFELDCLLCPYCQSLLFGRDAESCHHLILRLAPGGYWAPLIDTLTDELKLQLNREISAPDEFKKFLIANPQLDWKRLSHREEDQVGITESMVFVAADPTQLFEQFSQWTLNAAARERRPTCQALRLTDKQRLTSRRIKKNLS